MNLSNIPQGYKQTELGIIPENWEIMTFDELGTFSKGSGVSRAESNTGNIPCIRYGELYTHHNDYIKAYNSYISKTVASKAKLLQYGDVLFAASGETKEEIGKSAAFVNSCEAYAGGDIIILSTNSKLCDAKYIGYASNAPYVTKQKATKGQGDAVVHITSEAIKTISINIPPIAEQRAIAEALSDVDGLIAALDKKIAKKRLLKQGAMQQLLTSKKRLPGFTDEWVEITFGEYVDIYRGGSPRPIENYITDNPNGVNWIKIGDVKPNEKYINKTEECIIPDGVSRSRRVYVGDFILSNSMSFGRPYILGIDGCIHDGWLVIQNYHNTFDKDYLYYLLCSEDVMMQYIGMAAGSSVKNLNKEKVASLQLCVPTTIKEQQAIATILSDMDKEIADLEAQRDKYRLLKSGMMQKLLTGQIRLKTE